VKQYRLIERAWPEFGSADVPASASTDELQRRLDGARSRMEQERLSHLLIYGDREHFANIAYMTGYDPRYEEALFVIRVKEKPLLVVGNEGEGYLNVSPLYRAGMIRAERFQSFSLLDQPRNDSRTIREILAGEGVDQASRVGCVGWKYFTEAEHADAEHALELPAFIVDALRSLSGGERVVNATGIFMSPSNGLRTSSSVAEIAYFEYANVLASEGIKRIVFGMREGMTDFEVVKLAEYDGQPLATHISLLTGGNLERSLSSPVGCPIRRGEPFSVNLSYWGSNCCRAGWTAETSADLPPAAADYVERFAGIYFTVMGEWFRRLRIGVPGGELYRLVLDNLPFERFGIFLNPGHLIHLDEWVSSPVFEDSRIPIRSGMTLQSDVIPVSSTYFSSRLEDGYVVADGSLRESLKEQFPKVYSRCQDRRSFMAETLGFELGEEVLPLSNIPGIVPPFFLAPNRIFAFEK
jgi:hypothetical protein